MGQLVFSRAERQQSQRSKGVHHEKANLGMAMAEMGGVYELVVLSGARSAGISSLLNASDWMKGTDPEPVKGKEDMHGFSCAGNCSASAIWHAYHDQLRPSMSDSNTITYFVGRRREVGLGQNLAEYQLASWPVSNLSHSQKRATW